MDLFTITFTVPGTLAANHTFDWKAFRNCTLLHVSAGNASANAGKIDVGPSTDPDGYLDEKNFGVSGAALGYGRADFNGAELANPGNEYPRINAGDVIHVTITDHASHMANACVVLTLVDG